MTSYILRNLPPELWKAVKTRAASEGRSLRSIILTMLEHYAQHGLPRLGSSRRTS